MHRVGNLYQDICDIENIKLAIWNASNRKRKRADVQAVLFDFNHFAYEIQDMLINKTYEPSAPKEKVIYCKSSKKYRTISIPKFYPDLCIQWAVMQILQPVFMKSMYQYSCGSVPGKGTQYARKVVEKWVRKDPKNTKYCLTMDIKKFYPSVNLGILKNRLRTKFKDRNVLWLLDTIIDVYDVGLPVGYYTSTWFSNFLLDELDHKIKEEFGGAAYYVRNVDDMNCYGANKKKLHKLREKISEYLSGIGLELKENWQVFKYGVKAKHRHKEGYRISRVTDFVGYSYYRTHTRLRKSIALNLRRKAIKIQKKGYADAKSAASLIASLGWSRHGDCYNYYMANIKHRVDMVQIKGVISNESRKRSFEVRKLYETIYRRCDYFR